MKRFYNKDTHDYDVVPSEGYGPNKILTTDADGNARWEERETPVAEGDVHTAIIRLEGYTDALSGIAPAIMGEGPSAECVNMTYEKAVAVIMSGQALMVITQWYRSEDNQFMNDICSSFSYNGNEIVFESAGYLCVWDANGIVLNG